MGVGGWRAGLQCSLVVVARCNSCARVLQEEAAVVQVVHGKQHLMRGKMLRVSAASGRLWYGQ